MSRGFLAGIIVGLSLSATLRATDPIYINSGNIEPGPRVDATAFVNEGVFSVPDDFPFSTSVGFENNMYDTQNTLYFTNRNSGVMQAGFGFHLDYATAAGRFPASYIVNDGRLDGGVYLLLNATNVINTGLLEVGASGLIRITGDNVDFSRGAIKTGGATAADFAPGFASPAFSGLVNGANNTIEYIPEGGITEVNWGAGVNGALTDQIPTGGANQPQDVTRLALPVPQTQRHQVLNVQGTTNYNTLAQFNFSGYAAFAQTNASSPTNLFVQVVFVPTNHSDTNFSVNVRFAPPASTLLRPVFPEAKTVAVQIGLQDVDPITAQVYTNLVYFVDNTATTTNFVLITNTFNTNYARPFPYVVTTQVPTEWAGGTTNNAVFTNTMLFGPTYSNQVVTNNYVGYTVRVGTAPGTSTTGNGVTINGIPLGGNGGDPDILAAINDVTNQPGRIEITAKRLDLGLFRLRSEGLVKIKADEYVGTAPNQVDAPFTTYDLGTTNTDLVVTNLLKDTVKRFAGTISAWTGFWTNQTGMVVTNSDTNIPPVTNVVDIITTVLVLDHSFVTTYPVEMRDLALRGKNIRLADNFSLQRNFSIDGESMTIDKRLTFSGTLSNWVSTNFSRIQSFTNLGTVSVPALINFGGDRAKPMASVVNRGTITSSGQIYRADVIENSGTLRANASTLSFTATALKLDNSTNRAQGDISVTATDAKIRNSVLFAGNRATNSGGLVSYNRGALSFNVSGSLSDGGPGASNRWTSHDGFRLLTRPLTGDLLGTEIHSVPTPFQRVEHIWAAEDRGATAEAYANNTAVGRLIIEGGLQTLHFFRGASTSNALYVDFLEFRNSATNVDAAMLIANNLTIYFAAANLPVEQLDGKFNGRLRWAKSFAGPNSTTNITLPNGQKFSVNLSLFNSLTADSDGDGLVNGRDPSPFDGVVVSKVSITNVPPLSAAITFPAAGNTVYYVDYTTALGTTNWINLLSLTNTAATNVLKTVTDPLPVNSPQRYYRVRYQP